MSHFDADGSASEGSDSEWEYEYHPTETETFYVTLDLSSATHDAIPRIKSDKPETPPVTPSTPPEGTSASAQLVDKVSAGEVNPAHPQLQMLDIHSKNPLVSFDGQLYSCTWARTIGTDMILASPDVKLPFEPVHREDGFQVAALSSIRLVGSSAKLVTKETSAAPLCPVGNSSSAHQLKIPLPPTANSERHKQAAFLERVANFKRAKGDTDEVIISRGKSYKDFVPESDAAQSPREYQSSRWKGKKAVTEPQEKRFTRSSQSGTGPRLRSSAARSDLVGLTMAGDDGEDLMDERDTDEMPKASGRVLRNGETDNRSREPDVQMLDADDLA